MDLCIRLVNEKEQKVLSGILEDKPQTIAEAYPEASIYQHAVYVRTGLCVTDAFWYHIYKRVFSIDLD